jgi:hypothetical protein
MLRNILLIFMFYKSEREREAIALASRFSSDKNSCLDLNIFFRNRFDISISTLLLLVAHMLSHSLSFAPFFFFFASVNEFDIIIFVIFISFSIANNVFFLAS